MGGGNEACNLLLILVPNRPRLDGAWGPWGPSHVLVAGRVVVVEYGSGKGSINNRSGLQWGTRSPGRLRQEDVRVVPGFWPLRAACSLPGFLCWVAALPLVAHAASTGWSLQPAADLASFPAPEATTSLVEPAQSCDPSWCSCKHHFCQNKDDGGGRTWLRPVLAKVGLRLQRRRRTGSTSLLEGLTPFPASPSPARILRCSMTCKPRTLR